MQHRPLSWKWQQTDRYDTTNQQTAQCNLAKEKANQQRCNDRQQRRNHHLAQCEFGDDINTAP